MAKYLPVAHQTAALESERVPDKSSQRQG